VYVHAKELCRMVHLGFSFPTRAGDQDDPAPDGNTRDSDAESAQTKRHILLDIPDVLLVTSIVLATKIRCPLDGVKRYPRDVNDPLALKMDWAVWGQEFAEPSARALNRLDFEQLTENDAWSMSEKELDEYLNWFQETQIEKLPAGNAIPSSELTIHYYYHRLVLICE
jgi:RNA polymerase I-specific transcription initiation factor RRN7